MAFTPETKAAAFRRSGGRCECTREHPNKPRAPHHGGRCPKTFTEVGGQWHAHHITSVDAGGSDALSNCEILCVPCHELTQTYGR